MRIFNISGTRFRRCRQLAKAVASRKKFDSGQCLSRRFERKGVTQNSSICSALAPALIEGASTGSGKRASLGLRLSGRQDSQSASRRGTDGAKPKSQCVSSTKREQRALAGAGHYERAHDEQSVVANGDRGGRDGSGSGARRGAAD